MKQEQTVTTIEDRRAKIADNIARTGGELFDWVVANGIDEFEGVKVDDGPNCDIYIHSNETDLLKIHHRIAEALDNSIEQGEIIKGKYATKIASSPEVDIEIRLFVTNESLDKMDLAQKATTDIVSIEYPDN